MRSHSRDLDRIRAIAASGLAPELAVPEMMIVLGRALDLNTYPAVFANPPGGAETRPQDFTAWHCAYKTAEELRQLLAMGIWPGPKDTPSLQRIMTERTNRRAFAATLWGEGCADEGPWGDLWRSRGIQQGLQLVAFAPSGKTCVAVMSRATGKPPFSAADLTLAEAAVPYVERMLDMEPRNETAGSHLYSVQIVLDEQGKVGAAAFGVGETLREAGGGGPGAVEAMIGRIEAEAAAFDKGETLAVEGDPFVALRRTQGTARPSERRVLSLNAFGGFAVSISLLAGPAGGKPSLIATVTRRVPRSYLVLRGAVELGLPAREMELTVALARGLTLEGAAGALGISLSSVKTLLDRFIERTGADGREAALDVLTDRARARLW
jgi:DNA-binding CsgD family transcriptional regulator